MLFVYTNQNMDKIEIILNNQFLCTLDSTLECISKRQVERRCLKICVGISILYAYIKQIIYISMHEDDQSQLDILRVKMKIRLYCQHYWKLFNRKNLHFIFILYILRFSLGNISL